MVLGGACDGINLQTKGNVVFAVTIFNYLSVLILAMHTEFRYILPMHYFLAIFAGVIWCLIIHSAKSWAIRSIQRFC